MLPGAVVGVWYAPPRAPALNWVYVGPLGDRDGLSWLYWYPSVTGCNKNLSPYMHIKSKVPISWQCIQMLIIILTFWVPPLEAQSSNNNFLTVFSLAVYTLPSIWNIMNTSQASVLPMYASCRVIQKPLHQAWRRSATYITGKMEMASAGNRKPPTQCNIRVSYVLTKFPNLLSSDQH